MKNELIVSRIQSVGCSTQTDFEYSHPIIINFPSSKLNRAKMFLHEKIFLVFVVCAVSVMGKIDEAPNTRKSFNIVFFFFFLTCLT